MTERPEIERRDFEMPPTIYVDQKGVDRKKPDWPATLTVGGGHLVFFATTIVFSQNSEMMVIGGLLLTIGIALSATGYILIIIRKGLSNWWAIAAFVPWLGWLVLWVLFTLNKTPAFTGPKSFQSATNYPRFREETPDLEKEDGITPHLIDKSR